MVSFFSQRMGSVQVNQCANDFLYSVGVIAQDISILFKLRLGVLRRSFRRTIHTSKGAVGIVLNQMPPLRHGATAGKYMVLPQVSGAGGG